ncbi:MAG: flagellar type III secretion system pore protein FliP [Phycisphaeraceae bacterium]|nr:flagellar type III secretion system pore protein FliP [Phycisphaeraceae bacterium]
MNKPSSSALFVACLLTVFALFVAPANAQRGPVTPEIELPARSPEPAPSTTVTPPALPVSFAGDGLPNPLEVLDRAGSAMTGSRATGDAPQGGLSVALNIMILLTVVALAPTIMLMTTCFLRVLLVLGLLKQAMGVTTLPPSQVITALALFVTLVVMTPTLDRINKEAIAPYRAGEITSYDELWEKASLPMRDFMFDQIEATGNWSALYMLLERQGIDTSDPSRLTRADVSMSVLIPAFMISELKTAFLMGFKLYLPFLVIDMVISTMLISMGMMMLPPVLVSLPFKLLLFVLVDGWTLVVGGLIRSFDIPHLVRELSLAAPPGLPGLA